MSKSLFLSKTFWMNLLAIVITVLTSVADGDFIARNPAVAQTFVLIVSSLNVLLRLLTDQPVHLGKT